MANGGSGQHNSISHASELQSETIKTYRSLLMPSLIPGVIPWPIKPVMELACVYICFTFTIFVYHFAYTRPKKKQQQLSTSTDRFTQCTRVCERSLNRTQKQDGRNRPLTESKLSNTLNGTDRWVLKKIYWAGTLNWFIPCSRSPSFGHSRWLSGTSFRLAGKGFYFLG